MNNLKKAKMKWVLSGLPGLMILVIPLMVFGQNIGFEDTLRSGIYEIFQSYIKPAVQIALFIWFIWSVLQGIIGRDKETNWWKVIGIVGAIAFIEAADIIYKTITGISIM